ncbi:MAG: adenylate/guanylate cyclase domain-containing protein [Sulfitobacter sp.]|nr:adenylate/guanylate cyclase domain-containing protein [Sulfitobacter sp.]
MERRIAAILAGDMVGFSRLTELDEIGTLTRQRKHMIELIDPMIERMNGHVVKLTGDGMIAEFGSVIDAVQCAVAIQKEMSAREEGQPEDRRIQYRMAVNLGDVVFEDGDVFGDGVNIAARLEALAEPGGIVVSGTAFDLLKANVDVGYRPMGEQRLKNIATPVRVYQVTEEKTQLPSPPRESRLVGFLTTIAAGILIAIDASWFFWQSTNTASYEKTAALDDDTLSIIVLPLDNLSGDPAQDYFADGLADDITTDLSQQPDLFVIARNTAFDYADRGLDPRQISQELGVRYVLEGSVRRVADTLRINVQLIDGKTGTHVWAERYDGELDDVLTFQNRIIGSIIASLPLHLDGNRQERSKAGETDNPLAFDAFLQGWEHVVQSTPEGFAAAVPHLKRAVKLDPNYGRAYAALASTYWEASQKWWYVSDAIGAHDMRKEAYKFIELAFERPTALAHRVASEMRRWDGKHDEMMKDINAAVLLDPNDPDNYTMLAFAQIIIGNPADALLAVDKAMALNPHYPPVYLAVKGCAYYMLKDYDTALEFLERSYSRNPQRALAVIYLIATYARLDRIEDAERVVSHYPSPLSVRGTRDSMGFRNPEDWAHSAEGMLKGGMPY